MNDRLLKPDNVPPIYVSKAGFDDMGAILDRLGIPYEPTRATDVSSLKDAVVMPKCKTTLIFEMILPPYKNLARDFRTLYVFSPG
jgi:hypothetical protein